MTQEVLEILVRDQVTRVRQVIAEALKDVVDVPPDDHPALAHDAEIAVAAPVLECSPLLTDDELLESSAIAPIPGALAAIARRTERGRAGRRRHRRRQPTSRRWRRSSPIPARRSARRRWTAWSIAPRGSPPGTSRWSSARFCRRALRESSPAFVADHLLRRLSERRDLDPAAARDVAAVVKRRLAEAGAAPAQRHALPTPASTRSWRGRAGCSSRASSTRPRCSRPCGSDRVFARAALAVLAALPLEVVDRVLAAHSPKGRDGPRLEMRVRRCAPRRRCRRSSRRFPQAPP